MWVKRYILGIFLLVVLLPSCGGKKKIKSIVPVSSSVASYSIESVYKEQSLKEAAFSAIRRCIDVVEGDDEHLVKKLEARCVDIPIPVYARPLKHYFTQTDDGNICIAYDSGMPFDAVFAFYQREMERSGWQRMAQLEDLEILLVYKKPNKICVVSLRPLSKRSHTIKIIITQMMCAE